MSETVPRFPRLRHVAIARELSRLRPWRTLAAVSADWAIVVAVAGLAWCIGSWWCWPLAWLVIAARQHALLILLHDAAHGAIVRHKGWNDAISDLVCGWPMLVGTAAYRASHLRHHRFVNTVDDPDLMLKVHRDGARAWLQPQSPWMIAARLAGLVLGGGLVAMVKKLVRYHGAGRPAEDPSPVALHVRWRWCYYLATAAGITAAGVWPAVLLGWYVPMFTFLPALMHLRVAAEHFGLPWDHELTQSRSVVASRLQRFLFAPHHIGLHGEHHLFASVPWYHLPRLREALLCDPAFAGASHANGYLWGSRSVVGDLVTIAPEAAWTRSL